MLYYYKYYNVIALNLADRLPLRGPPTVANIVIVEKMIIQCLGQVDFGDFVDGLELVHGVSFVPVAYDYCFLEYSFPFMHHHFLTTSNTRCFVTHHSYSTAGTTFQDRKTCLQRSFSTFYLGAC